MIFVCSIPGGDLRGPKQFPGSKYALHIFSPISKLTLWHPMELVWVNPNNLEYMVESIIDICTSNILFPMLLAPLSKRSIHPWHNFFPEVAMLCDST